MDFLIEPTSSMRGKPSKAQFGTDLIKENTPIFDLLRDQTRSVCSCLITILVPDIFGSRFWPGYFGVRIMCLCYRL